MMKFTTPVLLQQVDNDTYPYNYDAVHNVRPTAASRQ